MSNATSENQNSIYYGVFKGYIPGVYDSMKQLKLVTSGYSGGAIYKQFDNYDDACVFAASGKVNSAKRCRSDIVYNEKNVKETKKTKKEGNHTLKKKKEEKEINKLAEEISAWKIHKEEFKEATVNTALHAKSFLESRGDISPKSEVSTELAKTLQHLSLDLSDLIDTTKIIRN